MALRKHMPIFLLVLSILLLFRRDLIAKALYNGGIVLVNHGFANNNSTGYMSIYAESLLRQAANWSNNTLIPQTGLALLYHSQNRYSPALTAWRRSAVDSDYLIDWALKNWAAKQYEEALVWLQYAKNINPDSAEAYYWTGRIYNVMQQPDSAIIELQKASELAPNVRDIWYELAQAYQSSQAWDLALKTLIKAQAGTESYHYVGQSNVLFEIGFALQYNQISPDLDAAGAAYAHALQVNEFLTKPWQKANTYYQRGLLLALQGEWEAAQQEYEQALALNPNAYNVRISYARALRNGGQQQLAIDVLYDAIKLKPNNIEAIILLGDFYYWDNEMEIALNLYKQAAHLAPTDKDIKQRLEVVGHALSQ